MPEEYTALVTALKSLNQGEEQNLIHLPMGESAWDVRPNAESYGLVSLDMEAGSLEGDSVKLDTAHEGSVDLFSKQRSGAGWVSLITGTLTEHCGSCWSLNSHTYERDTGWFHWEWTFEV